MGGKNSLLKKWSWDMWISTDKGKSLYFYLASYTIINSKRIIDPTVQARMIKLLEETIGVNLYDVVLGNSF